MICNRLSFFVCTSLKDLTSLKDFTPFKESENDAQHGARLVSKKGLAVVSLKPSEKRRRWVFCFLRKYKIEKDIQHKEKFLNF